MSLDNKWVRYIDRSYLQIKQRVLTDMQVLVPEITDHTESNPYVGMLSIWAGIAEMIGYYLDNAAREAHLPTARLYWSGVKIAESYDYRIHNYLASTAEVTFRLDNVATSDVLIPLGTKLETEDGVPFYTEHDLTIYVGQIEGTVTAKQYEQVAEIELGISDGSSNQTFVIDGMVVDGSIILKVGGIGWDAVNTLGYSLPNDRHFVQTINTNKKPIIRFGDGINGLIPESGSTINVSYQKTLGDGGNVGSRVIRRIVDDIPLPTGFSLEVYNTERSSGGSDIESLEQIKRRIPKANRTLMRAVTKQDFIDVAELKSGVAKAGVDHQCGRPVKVYIVPEGGGIASNTLLDETQLWMEERRLITVGVEVLRAGEIRMQFVINLRVLPQYTRSVVVANVRANIVDFLSYRYQGIGGDVYLSDIYEIIENTEGVKNSTIEIMRPRPYARPVNNETNINWLRTIQEGSTGVVKWTIKMISDSTYELTKDNSIIGAYSVGTLVSMPEITFRIDAGNYVVGDIWEFFTYPYFGNITISEQSLPVSLPEDISITATGGL